MKLKIYEGCEKQLRDVEERLVEVYGSVVGELEVCEDGVNEEVIGLLKEAERRRVERIELCGHHLPFLPEAFGKLHGLAFLNPSHNHLDVCIAFFYVASCKFCGEIWKS